MDALGLLALALAPGTAIVIYIYLKDQHEREPLRLLILSFFYGVLSTLMTLSISHPIELFLSTKDEDVITLFVTAFFKVALVEEFSKFVFVRFILFRNKNFNEPFDGIVYAVMVSMGFATLENILYVEKYGVVTAILRMFTAVPAHATFGILMGYFLGLAKFSHNRGLMLSLIALAVPTIFHGAYDYFWFIAELENVYTGIWIFAIISLIVAFVLSRKAIRLHQQASPFIQQEKEIEKNDNPDA
jgi:RsiW-degrading membrane proteinase PrsW (M82 family)